MKNIVYYILLIVAFSGVNSGSCQDIPKPGSNVAHPSLDRFVGDWILVNQTDTIWLKLKKENVIMPSPFDFTQDMIVGYYRYVKGKNVIFDNLKHFDHKYSGKYSPFIATPNQTENEAEGGFRDFEKNKSFRAVYKISKDRKSLEIVLSNREGLMIGAKEGNSLPLNMLFIKKQ